MITLHHLRIGRSLFTVWLLEELAVDYQLKVYHRDPITFRAGDDLKLIHPLGKSPVIEDDGLILSESAAIVSYILEKYDCAHVFSPARSELSRWAEYNQWLHYPEGSVFLSLLVRMLMMRSDQTHTVLQNYSEREIELHLRHISTKLAGHDYILGQKFSAADFGISYVLSMAKRLGLIEKYPSLNEYLIRTMARDAWRRTIEKAVE